MKKLISFVVAAVVGGAAYAENIGGGFNGPVAGTVKTTSVADAIKMRDDTHVVLRGHIVNSLGDEKYTFADDTGTVIVEIDNDDWNGVNVTPETTIEIFGEVDKGLFKKTKIDVDSINIK